jgi:UDP-sugar transporter A1/2/3
MVRIITLLLDALIVFSKYTPAIALVKHAARTAIIQMEGDSNKPAEGSTFIGIIAVLAACFTSAMAGVYLEKTIKASSKSVMIRTIQLGAWGILLGSIGAYQRDGVAIREKGFFFDYNSLVWLVIFLQALGGIVIGMVMKYADNILKCFANASSIVITILIEGGNGLGFIPGTSLVILATSMYGMDASPLDVLSGAKPLMSKLLSKIRPSLE